MKATLLSLATAAIWSAVPLVHAAPQQAPVDVTPGAAPAASMDSVVVSAHRFHVEPQEFMDYEYSYHLSSGDTVRFSRRVGRFYIELHGEPREEIFPVAPGKFVTNSGAGLRFTEGGDKLTIDNYERVLSAAHMASAATH